jgi:cytoskeletal protein RodZ
MPDSFDPYHKWLAIPPEDQPPSHYRLLVIDAFEQDKEVIANAAEQRLSHLRILEMGEQGATATELIKEIKAARSCLLDPQTRSSYEAQLRGESSAEPVVELESPKGTGSTGRKKGKAADKRAKKISIIGHIVAPIVGLALGGIILWVIKSMPSEQENPSQIDFEIGGMRQAVEEQEAVAPDAGSEEEESQGPDATELSLPDKNPNVADAEYDQPEDQATALEASTVGAGQGTEEESVSQSDFPDSTTATDTAATDDIATETTGGSEESFPDSFPATEVELEQEEVPLENVAQPEDQRAEKEAALASAIELGDLLLQLELAENIAKLQGEDSWDRALDLYESFQNRAANVDDRVIVEAALLLSSRAQEAGQAEKARVLAVDALRSARRDGDPALTREVTAHFLRLSSAESE